MGRSSYEFGSDAIGSPSEECEERVEGVNLGELSSVLMDPDSCGLRRDEDSMADGWPRAGK